MANHTLDFTHAFGGRLGGNPPVFEAQRVEELSQRLAREIAAGNLPTIDFSFSQELVTAIPQVLSGLPPARHLIVLGIGGSALGARALQKAFAPGQDRPGHTGPWLWIADNIDALTLDAWLTSLPHKETVVTVISKSGGTIETMAQYVLLRSWLQKHCGSEWKKHVVIITDPASGPLRAEAEQEGIASLPVPSALGGRYSVLSAVGLFPAAFMGMDWQGVLRGAQQVAAPLAEKPETLAGHPAFALALWAHGLMQNGYNQLIFFSYIPLWNYLGAWFAQLWAESLGKDGKGSMPLPAVGVTDQHSLQQMFLDGPKDKGCIFVTAPGLPGGPSFGDLLPETWGYLRGKQFGDLLQAEAIGTRMALVQEQTPLTHLSMGLTDEEACGRLMALLMATTIFTGWLLDINPLDQPAVELGKRLANAKLGAKGYKEESKALAAFLAKEQDASPFAF